MGCWIGRSYEVLVTPRDVEYRTAARCIEPPGASQQLEESRWVFENQLVAVADEEVGVKSSQVERYVPDAMSTINAAQDPGLLALRRKTLERKAHARHADDRIKEGDLWFHSFTPDLD